MKKGKSTAIIIGIAVVAIVVLFGWYAFAPSELNGFAECLGEKGVTFYGAYWCPHCNDQKALFGNAQKRLPYVECSLPNRGGQNEMCNEAGIQSYPTWEFADGTRLTGVLPLETLSERSGCPLP